MTNKDFVLSLRPHAACYMIGAEIPCQVVTEYPTLGIWSIQHLGWGGAEKDAWRSAAKLLKQRMAYMLEN